MPSIPNLHEFKSGHPQGRAGCSEKHGGDVGLIVEGVEQPRSEDERGQRRPLPVTAAGLEEMFGVYNEGRGELLELEAAGDGPGDVLV